MVPEKKLRPCQGPPSGVRTVMGPQAVVSVVERPSDPPATCPVCTAPYESVSRHGEDDGLVVNLRENRRYARVCFDPLGHEDSGVVDFYHHTHEDVA
jgi:hypothetical protein